MRTLSRSLSCSGEFMILQEFDTHGVSSDFAPQTASRQKAPSLSQQPAMFTELTILRAVRRGVVWKHANFDDFDQIVALCRKLRDEGYFLLAEKRDLGATETLVISDFTEAGMARLDVLRQE